MATHRIPVLGAMTKPDSSGEVWFEPFSIEGSNDLYDHLVLVFDDPSGRVACYGSFEVPKDYVGSGKFILIYTSPTTAGNRFRFELDINAVGDSDTESLDPSASSASAAVNASPPSTAFNRMETSMSLSGLTASESVVFGLFRDGGQASPNNDDVADKAMILAVMFEYSDA